MTKEEVCPIAFERGMSDPETKLHFEKIQNEIAIIICELTLASDYVKNMLESRLNILRLSILQLFIYFEEGINEEFFKDLYSCEWG